MKLGRGGLISTEGHIEVAQGSDNSAVKADRNDERLIRNVQPTVAIVETLSIRDVTSHAKERPMAGIKLQRHIPADKEDIQAGMGIKEGESRSQASGQANTEQM